MARRSTGPSPAVREAVIERDDYSCLRCGLGTFDGQVHHRCPRRAGGTRNPAINYPSNLCYLCGNCHEYIESNRALAIIDGWLLRTVEEVSHPVRSYLGWVMLAADGTRTMIDQPTEEGTA